MQELWLAESVTPPPPHEKCSAQAGLPGSLKPRTFWNHVPIQPPCMYWESLACEDDTRCVIGMCKLSWGGISHITARYRSMWVPDAIVLPLPHHEACKLQIQITQLLLHACHAGCLSTVQPANNISSPDCYCQCTCDTTGQQAGVNKASEGFPPPSGWTHCRPTPAGHLPT